MSTVYNNRYSLINNFAKQESLTFVIFNREDDDCFANVFNQIYPNLTNHYEKYNKYEPFYNNNNKVCISIDQHQLDKTLATEEISFTIRSNHKNELAYVGHVSTDNFSAIPEIYDVVFGPSLNHVELFYEYLKNKCKPLSHKNQIYIWNKNHGEYQRDCRKTYDKSIGDLFGLNTYYQEIMDDFTRYKSHKDLLIKLGESNGLNYMLYGPPGTGKSSFIRAISCEMEVSLCIAKLTMATNENQITDMLIPRIESDHFKIVLIEDFDRYLETLNGKTTMSAVLNALDGVFPSYNVIRFFSANNPNIVSNNGALVSRMNRIMYFDLPNYDQIRNLICNAYQDKVNHELLDKVVNEFIPLKLSMRQITHYVCRYLDSNDPLRELLNNKDKWIENMSKFNKYRCILSNKDTI